MSVAKLLIQNKCHTLPQVHITDEVEPKLAAKLKDIIKRHQVNHRLLKGDCGLAILFFHHGEKLWGGK